MTASQPSTWIAVSALALAGLVPAGRAAWRVEDLKPLTRSGQAVAPVVSPDGQRVAYLVGTRQATAPAVDAVPAADTLTGRLWTLDRKTGTAERLGKFGVSIRQGEAALAFSPKGDAYACVEGQGAARNLWYVAPDGNRYRVGGGGSASFSPKGDYLAYLAPDTGRGDEAVAAGATGASGASGAPVAVELWLFDTERRESKRLARIVTPAEPPVLEAPGWMPDGARIVFRARDDLYAYARYTGRIEALTRAGDVQAFDVAPSGALWYYRNGHDRAAAGLWTMRPDGKVTLRAFRLDEMPPDMSDLTAGPDADTVLFIADTAAGRGLVAADAVSGRWRYLAAADALALRPGGREIALEVPAGSGRHNIYYGRLAPEPSRSGRTDARALKTSRG